MCVAPNVATNTGLTLPNALVLTKEFNPTFLDLVTSQPLGGSSAELAMSAAVLDAPAETSLASNGGQAFVQAVWLKDFLDGASGGEDPNADLEIALSALAGVKEG